MKYQSLVDTLQLLTKEEFKSFERFISLGYFNRNKRCIELFKIYKTYKFNFEHPKLNIDKTYHPIAKNVKTVSSAASELKDLVEKFLAQQLFEGEYRVYQDYLMLVELYNRKYKDFSKKQKQLEKKHLQNSKKGIVYHYGALLMEKARRANSYEEETKSINYKSRAQNTQKLLDALDSYYLIEKLSTTTELINLNYLAKIESDIPNLELMLALSNQSPFSDNPTVQLFKMVFDLLHKSEDNFQYFNKIQETLQQFSTTIPKEELNILYTYCINHCTRKLRQTTLIEYYTWIAYFTEEQLKHDLANLHELPFFLKNITICYARVQNFEYSRQLLGKYKDLLPENVREGTYWYCRGFLAFYQKEHDQALRYLRDANIHNHPFKTDNYALELKIYYTEDDFDILENRSRAFREYLRVGNNISNRTAYLNFRKFLMILAKLKRAGSLYRGKDAAYFVSLNETKQEIEDLNEISDKRWLMTQIDLLK